MHTSPHAGFVYNITDPPLPDKMAAPAAGFSLFLNIDQDRDVSTTKKGSTDLGDMEIVFTDEWRHLLHHVADHAGR